MSALAALVSAIRANLRRTWWIAGFALAIVCGLLWGTLHTEIVDGSKELLFGPPWFAYVGFFCLGLAGGWISVFPGTRDPDFGAAAERGVLGSLALIPSFFVIAGIVVGYDGEYMTWLVMLSPFIGAGPAVLLMVGCVVGAMSRPVVAAMRG